MDVATVVKLMGEKQKLEVRADRHGAAVQKALNALFLAVRDHGENSPAAIAAEKRYDALFDRGEAIAARLQEIEVALGAAPQVVAEAA